MTPPDLPEFARISLIEASPHQNGVAYLAANRYQMGDRAPYFYKTADFGKTWQKIISGIPGTDFARVIREDIKRRGLLYAGTEHGIYVSFNDGATWQSLKLDLPTTPVHGIIPEERDLVIGTHGRGFYVLDNISVLRQATPELTSNPLFLFEPFNPMRGRDRNVTFDYYLNTEAPEVKIEFLDAGGTVLRTFTGTPKTAAPAVDDGDFFGFAPPRVNTAKGINRFTWDMRYEGATVFPGMIMWAAQPQRGPAAPPGRYSVRITANGKTTSRDFNVTVDPRLVADGISEADLLEQFKLSVRVRDKVSEANQAVIDIRSLRDQVNQRLREGLRAPQGRNPEARRRGAGAAESRGGRGLPGPQPQRPGSAQLSDQVEQQDRGARRRDRERRQQADRSERRSVQRAVRAARRAAGEDEGHAVEAAAVAQRRVEAREAGCGRSESEAGCRRQLRQSEPASLLRSHVMLGETEAG